MICAGFIISISGNLGKEAAAIEYTRYRIPWQGDPRVNIQNDRGKTKAYQVKQVLRAIEKLEVNYGTEK